VGSSDYSCGARDPDPRCAGSFLFPPNGAARRKSSSTNDLATKSTAICRLFRRLRGRWRRTHQFLDCRQQRAAFNRLA
jgi:hypothetical protein